MALPNQTHPACPEVLETMKVVIMGCGRVGAELATLLDREGNDVTILDLTASAFSRLPTTFSGTTVVGNGIDVDVLRRVGVGDSDAFVSVTQGDNRNVMAAQIAQHVFHVKQVVCRIYDPIRDELYKTLGLRTISPTKIGAQLMKEALEQ
jgi:trk system potassium uptake protein TrkA